MGYTIPRILLIVTLSVGLALCLATLFIGGWMIYVSDSFGHTSYHRMTLLSPKMFDTHSDLSSYPESKWKQLSNDYYSEEKYFIARILAFVAPAAAGISLISLFYEIITKNDVHIRAAQIAQAVLLPISAACQSVHCYIIYRIIDTILKNHADHATGVHRYEEGWCVFWAIAAAGLLISAVLIDWTLLSVEYNKRWARRRGLTAEKPMELRSHFGSHFAETPFRENIQGLHRGFSSISDTNLELDYKAMEAELQRRKVNGNHPIHRCQSADELSNSHKKVDANSNDFKDRLSKARISLVLNHEWPQMSQAMNHLQPMQPWHQSPSQPSQPVEHMYLNMSKENMSSENLLY